MFRFFCNCCISLVFEDQLIKTRRWCSEMKVWIGHLVSPIRPTLCPHPSLSGQQTNTATSPTLAQHYNTCTTGCLSNTLQRFATSATTPLHHTGWLNCHIWGSEEAKPGPLGPPQNGKLTTPLIHRVNLANNFFYHLSNSTGSSPVLQLLTKVVVFLLLIWGDSIIWIGENWTNILKETNKMLKLKPMTKASRN